MNPIIAFEQSAVERLRKAAEIDPLETCAAGLVATAGTRAGRPRLLVRELAPVSPDAYVYRSAYGAELSPAFCMSLANRARASGCGAALAHTHPGSDSLGDFSQTDNRGEAPLRAYFDRRAPGSQHVSALVTVSGGACRSLGARGNATFQVVGRYLREIAGVDLAAGSTIAERYDRQVRIFGPDAQRELHGRRVAVVGCGGTGSFVATELAYLGVGDFLLIDNDVVDESNLNRLIGATPADVGTSKAVVAANWISKIAPQTKTSARVADVVDHDVAIALLDCDFIFLCTDSHASRAIVNQIAYQYLIPTIDVGVAIHSRGGTITDVVGRVQMLSSGLPCLVCSGWIDSNQVRTEMMNAEQRRTDPYFSGPGVPQPAVVSLNGTVSSLAITMFLSATAGVPSAPRLLLYDALRGAVRPTAMDPVANCLVCSSTGSLARGDTWDLPTRRDAVR